MSRRKKTKYPNLNPGLNLKKRTEIIETDYVNGVRNEKGELVIRPLTDEEKAWLDKFYKEYANGEKLSDDSFHDKRHQEDIYLANNARNRDIYNCKKQTKKLKQLDVEEYDRFLSDIVSVSGRDPESVIENEIDKRLKQIKRKKKIEPF